MSQEGSTSTGSNIVVAGLFVQIVFFDLFFITEMRFALYEKASLLCSTGTRESVEIFELSNFNYRIDNIDYVHFKVF